MFKRFRQFRTNQEVRDKNADVNLEVADFIYPYFVVEGTNKKEVISSLKDVYHFSVDRLLEDVQESVRLGIDKILIFGVVQESIKDELATGAYADGNIVAKAVSAVKTKFPDLIVITDVCVCAYTNHGHCGVLQGHEVDNDASLPLLAKMALSHAKAGADIVAPSAMMDGQVQAIRSLLDSEGFQSTKILAYSAKYSSGFYGPFRDAAQSAPSFGDRKSYQMDFRTINQGVDEMAADLEEGAEWIMVKPAHAYLDVIARGRERFPGVHISAYHVSGEYMMIVAAGEKGYLIEDVAMVEALTAMKRAGASSIISYYAKKFAQQRK